MKKIVVITQYFPPEIGGGSNRSFGFVDELFKLGCNVTVLAPFASYLMDKTERRISLKFYENQSNQKFNVFRTFVLATDRGKFLSRIVYYLSFTISSLIVAIFKIKNVDYIITISPPLFTGITGVLLKKLKNSKLVFDIGDLWPESVIQLGYLKNKNAIKISKILEKWIYKRSDYINITTKKTIEWFQNQFPDIKSINFVPNFVDTDSIIKIEKNNQLVNKLNLQNKTVFGYAGNIGSAQGVKIILEAAELTIEYYEIIYIIIGDGVERPILQDILEKKNLTNVLLLPPIPKEDLLNYISLFDVAIIPLIKIDLFKITIPSKLYECMAAETPVLLCVDGEARKILEESNCGYYIEPENYRALAEMIIKLYKNKSMLAELGKNGRIAAEKFYSKFTVVKNFFYEISK